MAVDVDDTPLDISQLSLFLSFIRHLRDSIEFTQHSTTKEPPFNLPIQIHRFLQAALDITAAQVSTGWSTLKDIAWKNLSRSYQDLYSLLPLFLEHGLPLRIGPLHLYPPVRTCIVPQCPNNPLYRNPDSPRAPDLGEHITHEATFFTRSYGSLPGFTTSSYCRGCLMRYHHNCFVSDNVRTYYEVDPTSGINFIQISTGFFIKRELCERFATQMAMAWTSAQNCARIYNAEVETYPWSINLPQPWPLTFILEYEQVSEAFLIHTLLDWHDDHGTCLRVPHQAPNQRIRFHDALQARNLALAGTGQPAWNHACSRCTKHITDDQGKIVEVCRSVVTDGVSLGHPCCAVHDCKEPLANNKHRYCPSHSVLREKCAVESCTAPVEPPFRTCTDMLHRQAEERYIARGKAMFQFKRRLEKAHGVADPANCDPGQPIHPEDAVEPEDDNAELPRLEDEIAVDEDGEDLPSCDTKPASGHRKVFARFGRRRTHNEELCVASCGVILGRATFYGAEGPNSVRLFWKALFPTKSSLPNVMWFDTNCEVAAMLQTDQDDYFDHVALPVDVFHFKSKHKASDEFCGKHCNPAQWQELMDEKTGEWTFNSSAAEQCNLWFGGFRSMTRSMRADRYNYFLDEMIMRRNWFTISTLEASGAAPYSIPCSELLSDWEET